MHLLKWLFELFIELTLMTSAPFLQITLSSKKLKGLIKTPLWAINVLALLFGFIFPVLATIVFMYSLSPGIKCASGAPGVAVLGILFTLITVPIISVANFFKYRKIKQSN